MSPDVIVLTVFIFVPVGILLMAFAALWQIYIMFSQTHTLNRYSDDRLVWVIATLMFSFSLAVYYFCPNARSKGKWFFISLILGLLMYTSRYWLLPLAL